MRIKAVRDPANRGYASAAAVMKPWRVYIGRRCLVMRVDDHDDSQPSVQRLLPLLSQM